MIAELTLENWQDYIHEHDGRFRAVMRQDPQPDRTLLLSDARAPGNGRDAVLRCLRRSARSEATDDELLATVGSKIIAQATVLRLAARTIGEALALECRMAIHETKFNARGARGWIACIGQQSVYVASVFYAGQLPLLDSARWFRRPKED